jgi:hypothetical protein
VSREPQPCGTPAAYQRHRKNGEPLDDACREAWRLKSAAYRAANLETARAADRESKRRRRREEAREPMPCGTNAARQRHVDRGEPVDEACAEAGRAYWRERNRKRREASGA